MKREHLLELMRIGVVIVVIAPLILAISKCTFSFANYIKIWNEHEKFLHSSKFSKEISECIESGKDIRTCHYIVMSKYNLYTHIH